MRFFLKPRYQNNVAQVASLPLDWEILHNRFVMISGATGMIGSFLTDVLMYKNQREKLNCQITALGRSLEKARDRFSQYWMDPQFCFFSCDVTQGGFPEIYPMDYIFHLASNTHPVAYATDPIGTITANVIGTHRLLDYAAEHRTRRFLFASSVEIYGQNRGDKELFTEDYCGYIDCNTLRAGYPESKRAGEALCQAYISQKNLDVVIPRLPRTYGPTMQMTDTKAVSQFIKKGLAKENIILKSEGTQYYSYSYVADAVAGLLYCLCFGRCGEEYNIADRASNITLRELAEIVAQYMGCSVVFSVPETVEHAGYSKATKALLSGEKLEKLGWRAHWDITAGIKETLEILG